MEQDMSQSSATFGYRDVDPTEKPGLVRGVFDRVASRYDLMNIHVYSAVSGISLGDPMGPVENGMPPNYGSYQLSIPNWGRYAMPGRRTIITESGANTRKAVPAEIGRAHV
jgi:hypothetical protein